MRHSEAGREKHQLYYFTTCPYCWFVRLYVLWKGIELPLKETMFSTGNRDELISGGGKFQEPCLRIEKDDECVEWLYESIEIVRYLGKGSFASTAKAEKNGHE